MERLSGIKKSTINFLSKAVWVVAMLFAICPCAGKMYEPRVPEKLKKE